MGYKYLNNPGGFPPFFPRFPSFGRAAVLVNCWSFEQLPSRHRSSLPLALEAARAQPALAHFATEGIRNEVVYLIKKEQPLGLGIFVAGFLFRDR
jgi:hypothetical protein